MGSVAVAHSLGCPRQQWNLLWDKGLNLVSPPLALPLDHQGNPSFNHFKKTEITSSIFLWPKWKKTIKQLQEENWKKTQTRRLNNMLLNNQWATEKSKEEMKRIPQSEHGNITFQNPWDAAKAVLRSSQWYRPTSINKKKISNKQPKFTFKEIRKDLSKSPKLVGTRKS